MHRTRLIPCITTSKENWLNEDKEETISNKANDKQGTSNVITNSTPDIDNNNIPDTTDTNADENKTRRRQTPNKFHDFIM